MEYELYHHGILGQKWGQRNGPPYPLSSSDHSAAERKANKMLQRAYNTRTELEKNQRRVGKLYAYRNSKRNQKLEMKRNKLQIKRNRLEGRVNSGRMKRELYDKAPNRSERRAMKKAYKLDTKIAKVERKQNIWQQKVNKLEYKNAKLDHKIDEYLAKADKISAKSNLGKDYVYNVLHKEHERLTDDAGKKYKAFQAAERAKDPNEERLYKDYHRRLEEAGIVDDLASREYVKRKKKG